MKRFISPFLLALCLSGAVMVPGVAIAQPSGSVNVDQGNDGTRVAVLQIGSGTDQFVVTVSEIQDVAITTGTVGFAAVGTDATTTAHRIVNFSLHNTHATNSLFFLLRNSNSEGTSRMVEVIAGSTVSLTGLLKINGGQGANVVSLISDGTNTTGQIIIQAR